MVPSIRVITVLFASVVVFAVSVLGQSTALMLSSNAGAPGTIVNLDLTLQDTATNSGPASLQFAVVYSTSDFSVLNVNASPAAIASGKSLTCWAPTYGRLFCLLYGMNNSVIRPGVVASISATLTSSLTTSRLIQITSTMAASPAGVAIPLTGSAGIVTVTSDATSRTYLSDQAFVSSVNGWGPVERDRSNGDLYAGDGAAITLNGQMYAKGLGIHATSNLRFNLNGNCTTFNADIGVDDEVMSRGSVIFQVWADGTKLFDSGIMRGDTATMRISVGITGRSQLALVVTDAGDGNAYDHADWANAWTNCGATTPSTLYLSDLQWTFANNGYGPLERDRSNNDLAAGDGRTITLNGKTYLKGLGAHAASDVRFNLSGGCSTFSAEIGVDDEVGSFGSVIFHVWADGTKLFDSGIMLGGSATQIVNVSVSGRKELRLIVTDAGDGIAWDHADWANARVTCGTP
jgi:hypothetical protein